MEGGYDDGYASCNCFWGDKPGSLIKKLENYIENFRGLKVLDIGCGEGKNSIYLARKGAEVTAIEISPYALNNAYKRWTDHNIISWENVDIRSRTLPIGLFDIVICYGLIHCLNNPFEVEAVLTSVKNSTRIGGYNIICSFNDRKKDLRAHKNFTPIFLSHEYYYDYYHDWEMLFCTDEDLEETHPHNNIPHTHSLTRLIARKR